MGGFGVVCSIDSRRNFSLISGLAGYFSARFGSVRGVSFAFFERLRFALSPFGTDDGVGLFASGCAVGSGSV
jgi:hypothetical protein